MEAKIIGKEVEVILANGRVAGNNVLRKLFSEEKIVGDRVVFNYDSRKIAKVLAKRGFEVIV